MTEKELRKLNRYQLLELLREQTERADQLQMQLDQMKKERARQEISLSDMGSIAEASLRLSGVFEAAQKAADLYVEAAKKRAGEIESQALKNASAILQSAENTNYYKAVAREAALKD